MADHTAVLAPGSGWLRNRNFDTTFVGGVLLIAFLSGTIVAARPELFTYVVAADLWLLGYHHVISTFTRLAFDKQSVKKYRFFLFVLPFIVFGATFTLAWSLGVWIVATVYLYWQWFHYTRQSWGISQVYRAKSEGRVDDSPLFSKLCFYLLPLWGILYRSWQAPDEFLFVELRVIPVPELLVDVTGFAAILSLLIWGASRVRALRAGQLPVAHTLYMLSHFIVFWVGYLLIDDITHGWLVINIWHNAQYILFVWLFNTNRFKGGIDSSAEFLSTISQPQNIFRYMFWCIVISSTIYLTVSLLTKTVAMAGLPLMVLIYQTVNFHHYIVDSRIWKVRKKPMQKTLELKPL
jgi:hypothetical protein